MEMTLRAYAKINLGLDVLRRLENGYHEVKMVMQTVGLYDELTFTSMDGEELTMSCSVPGLPCDGTNLVLKAAELMKNEYHFPGGLHIHLEKKIPMAAGMAGGSTDAAAVFVAVNRMYSLGLSTEELQAKAVKIGADVPYCIMGGTALSEGIGEVLTRLPDAPKCFVVIAKPPVDVSTAFVYKNLRLDLVEKHPDIDGITAAIRDGSLRGVAERLENVLETVTVPAYPLIDEIRRFLEEKGAMRARMSGSGPTVFGLFTSEETAEEAARLVVEAGLVKEAFFTEFVNETCTEVQK